MRNKFNNHITDAAQQEYRDWERELLREFEKYTGSLKLSKQKMAKAFCESQTPFQVACDVASDAGEELLEA